LANASLEPDALEEPVDDGEVLLGEVLLGEVLLGGGGEIWASARPVHAAIAAPAIN
jgi:hypothetical protein